MVRASFHTKAAVIPRVVSLIPSATEIVYFLGLDALLVGRSHECDFPSSVKKLPACTKACVDTTKTSFAINLDAHKRLQQGLSLFEIDWDILKNCRPDVILTQSLCRACAVDLSEIERLAKIELGPNVKIIDSRPRRLIDVWNDIEKIGKEFGAVDTAARKISALTNQVETIFKKTANIEDKPTVAAIEWIDPLMCSGNWVPELIELAGGKNIFGHVGEPSNWVTWETLKEANPDIIVMMACGFNIERSRQEMGPLTLRPGWYDLNAVQNNRVFLCDGNQFFNRPGPRLVESLEILSEIIHPDIFDFGHKFEGWEYWGFDRVH